MRDRKRVIYVIEMWDQQFGWVRCMENFNVPTCVTKRVAARAKIQQMREQHAGKFRIIRYEPVQP